MTYSSVARERVDDQKCARYPKTVNVLALRMLLLLSVCVCLAVRAPTFAPWRLAAPLIGRLLARFRIMYGAFVPRARYALGGIDSSLCLVESDANGCNRLLSGQSFCEASVHPCHRGRGLRVYHLASMDIIWT